MSPVLLALAAAGGVALVILGAGGAVFGWRRSRDRNLRRRLGRAAAALAGPAAAGDSAGGAGAARRSPAVEESIFRPTEKRSWLSGLRDRIESRYPLVKARRALPASVGIGLAGAGGCWFSMWFLSVPTGWWTVPAAGLAGAGAGWYALSWIQARQVAEFIRQFPEIVDQIVRLAGAGVPALEALSVVTEDAPEPIEPILRNVRDGLLAGLDADIALRMACDRVRIAEFTLFAAVIRLQRRAGGGISAAFSNLSETLRERRTTALKAHASTAQTRLTLLVLMLMPVVVLVAQKFIAPQSVEILFSTEQGTTLLRWGVGLIVAGLLVARSIAARAMR